MSFQDELSQNARDYQATASENAIPSEPYAMENAKQNAEEVISQIKSLLLQNVQQGKYTRVYNKGRVTCHYQLPQNRYMEISKARVLNPKTGITHDWYKFLIDPKRSKECTYFRNILNSWCSQNNTEISWSVKTSLGEFSFPYLEYTDLFPLSIQNFKLTLTVISYFPVDARFPIDHLTDDDLADQARKKQKHIEYIRKQCFEAGRACILVSLFALLCAVVAFVGFRNEEYSAGVALSFFCIILIGIAYTKFSDYRDYKASLKQSEK